MPDSKRQFYKTEIKVWVYSEDRPAKYESLSEIAHAITEGGSAGGWTVESEEAVDGPTMAKLLIENESDPEFFNLTEEGDDIK